MGRRIKHTSRDVEELARLMLAEAVGEGVQGMNMVGSVVANRVEADCAPDFNGLRNIRHAIYQTIPGTSVPHFEPVLNGTLYTQRPDEADLQRARKLLQGHREPRARMNLWFFNPSPGKNTENLVPKRCQDPQIRGSILRIGTIASMSRYRAIAQSFIDKLKRS